MSRSPRAEFAIRARSSSSTSTSSVRVITTSKPRASSRSRSRSEMSRANVFSSMPPADVPELPPPCPASTTTRSRPRGNSARLIFGGSARLISVGSAATDRLARLSSTIGFAVSARLWSSAWLTRAISTVDSASVSPRNVQTAPRVDRRSHRRRGRSTPGTRPWIRSRLSLIAPKTRRRLSRLLLATGVSALDCREDRQAGACCADLRGLAARH